MQAFTGVNLLPTSAHLFQAAITFGDDFGRFAFSLPSRNGRNAFQRCAPPGDNPLLFKSTVTGCRRLAHQERNDRRSVPINYHRASRRSSSTASTRLFLNFNRGSLKKSLGNLPVPRRSEEHTSELQSQSNLVCR